MTIESHVQYAENAVNQLRIQNTQHRQRILAMFRGAIEDLWREYSNNRITKEDYLQKAEYFRSSLEKYKGEIGLLDAEFSKKRHEILHESKRNTSIFRQGMSRVKAYFNESTLKENELIVLNQKMTIGEYESLLKTQDFGDIDSGGLANYFIYLKRKNRLRSISLLKNSFKNETVLLSMYSTWIRNKDAKGLSKLREAGIDGEAMKTLGNCVSAIVDRKQNALTRLVPEKNRTAFKIAFEKVIYGNNEDIVKTIPKVFQKYAPGKTQEFSVIFKEIADIFDVKQEQIVETMTKSTDPNQKVQLQRDFEHLKKNARHTSLLSENKEYCQNANSYVSGQLSGKDFNAYTNRAYFQTNSQVTSTTVSKEHSHESLQSFSSPKSLSQTTQVALSTITSDLPDGSYKLKNLPSATVTKHGNNSDITTESGLSVKDVPLKNATQVGKSLQFLEKNGLSFLQGNIQGVLEKINTRFSNLAGEKTKNLTISDGFSDQEKAQLLNIFLYIAKGVHLPLKKGAGEKDVLENLKQKTKNNTIERALLNREDGLLKGGIFNLNTFESAINAITPDKLHNLF